MRFARVAAVAAVALALGACSFQDDINTKRGRGDAPTGVKDNTPKDVVQFPDRFSNVAHGCDGHGHRIYVTTQTESGRQMEVIDDPSC